MVDPNVTGPPIRSLTRTSPAAGPGLVDRRCGARQPPGQIDADRQPQQQHAGNDGIDRLCDQREPVDRSMASAAAAGGAAGATGSSGSDGYSGSSSASSAGQNVSGAGTGSACRVIGHRGPVHQQRHRQRRQQHDDPRRHVHVRIAHAKKIQANPHDASQHQGAQRRLRQNREHHFFLPFALASRDLVGERAQLLLVEHGAVHHADQHLFDEPLQNQSTMRCTALAATRPRASAA